MAQIFAGILANVAQVHFSIHNLSTYCFKTSDIAVAALIHSYLNTLTEDAALEALEDIVSVDVRELPAQSRPIRIRFIERLIPQERWMTLDGKRLAALIDTARAAASISAESWQKQADESPIKKAIDYVKDDLLVNLSGERYVAAMPVEMAEFITDCYLYLRNN